MPTTPSPSHSAVSPSDEDISCSESMSNNALETPSDASDEEVEDVYAMIQELLTFMTETSLAGLRRDEDEKTQGPVKGDRTRQPIETFLGVEPMG